MDSPAARSAHEDLLAPVLTPLDDFAGFRGRPWNPWVLIVWAFFAMPFGAGALFALNFHRLGKPRAAVACALGFCAVGLLSMVAALFWISDRETAKFVMRVTAGLAGITAASLQQRRFHLFVVCDGKPGRTLVPGVLAIAGGIATFLALGRALIAITGVTPP